MREQTDVTGAYVFLAACAGIRCIDLYFLASVSQATSLRLADISGAVGRARPHPCLCPAALLFSVGQQVPSECPAWLQEAAQCTDKSSPAALHVAGDEGGRGTSVPPPLSCCMEEREWVCILLNTRQKCLWQGFLC